MVWIPEIPENERDCYLGVPLESQTTNPNQQLTISWIFIRSWKTIQNSLIPYVFVQPASQWASKWIKVNFNFPHASNVCHLFDTLPPLGMCREWGPTVPGGEFFVLLRKFPLKTPVFFLHVWSTFLKLQFNKFNKVVQDKYIYISRFMIHSFIVVIASHYKDPGVLFTNRFEGKLQEL